MGEPSPEFDLNLFWKIMVRGRNVLICTDSRSNWGERPWFWGRWRAWLVIFKKVEATKQVGQQHIDPCPYPTWDWHVRITYVWDDFMRCTPWSSKTPFVARKTSALLDMLGPSKPYVLETSWAQNLQLKLKPEETTPKTASHFLEIALFPHFPTFSHIFPTFSRTNVGFSHLFHGRRSESLEWLNDLVLRLWPKIDLAVQKIIHDQVWMRWLIWVWVNTYRYIFSGMNIHLPAILGFTRYQGFDPSPYVGTLW